MFIVYDASFAGVVVDVHVVGEVGGLKVVVVSLPLELAVAVIVGTGYTVWYHQRSVERAYKKGGHKGRGRDCRALPM